MDFKFTFKHLEPLDSITNYAESRFEKLDKFAMSKEMKIHFIFSVQKSDQTVEVLIDNGHNHYNVVATDPTLYTAIDKAVEKVGRQLAKHKEKVQNHHHFESSKEGYLRQELAEQARNLHLSEDQEVASSKDKVKRTS